VLLAGSRGAWLIPVVLEDNRSLTLKILNSFYPFLSNEHPVRTIYH